MTWGGKFETYLPEQVSIRSVGPGRPPARLTLHATLDQSLNAQLTGVRVLGAGGVSAKVGAAPAGRTAAVELRGRLEAEGIVNIVLTWRLSTPSGPLPGFSHPLLEVVGVGPRRRTTRTESRTRLDSKYDDASVKEWGQ